MQGTTTEIRCFTPLNGITLENVSLVSEDFGETWNWYPRMYVRDEAGTITAIRYFTDKADGLRLLTTLDEKICLLERLGIDNLVIIPFDRAFSRLAPDEFVRDCLVGHTGAETLVVGFNHRFGHNKQGSYDYLDSHGFGLRVIEVSECDVDAEKVSSTVIRRLVEKGEMARAAHLLSHPYLVIGRAQRNRIRVDDPLKLLPPPGEYDAHINGKPARLTVDAAQELITRDILPEGRVVITF